MMKSVLVTLVMLFILCSIVSYQTNAFDYSGFCRQKCMRGHGGNLCKCNAVHFAGKRTGTYIGSIDDSPDVALDGFVSSKIIQYFRKKLADSFMRTAEDHVSNADWLSGQSHDNNRALPLEENSAYVQQFQNSNQ